ncbi:MAG: L-threonylcarbamoyladenylate synthase [Verrucomicrobiota bacterium]
MKPAAIAETLPTHTAGLFQTAVRRAAELLRAGELVALPTETVYGLAANAFDEKAVAKIFQVKGRPAHNPIIVHVSSLEMAQRCVSNWPPLAEKLAEAFWPGPLTLILPRSAAIPDVVTAGGTTVGVRWPVHPIIQAVIRDCNFPLAAPSANRSNEISPTNAAHVKKSLGEKIRLIVDGGQSQVGIESTVVDLTVDPPRLLRPGMIHAESLLAVTGSLAQGTEENKKILRSPGLLRKHYSPRAKLVIFPWRNDAELKSRLAEWPFARGQIHIIAHTHIPLSDVFGRISVIPHDADAFARALYAELHQCDEAGAELIVVEDLPNSPAWRGVKDRLQRAAAE